MLKVKLSIFFKLGIIGSSYGVLKIVWYLYFNLFKCLLIVETI